MLNIVFWIWSHFPVICLSDDDNFATLTWKNIKTRKTHLRISLFNLMMGDKILYFVTFDLKHKKLQTINILCLENIEGILLTEKMIEDIQSRYKAHIKDLSENELEIERESLCYHIQNEEQRINSSIDKLNIYATIILTVLPLILAIIDFKEIVNLSLPLLIGVILLAYSLLNICAYIFRTIKIRGIMKSSFGDLRKSQDKGKCLVMQYQYDWQQLRYKAQLFVSFVLNLQDWVIAILIISAFVSFGISFENTNWDNKADTLNYNMLATVNLNELEVPYSESAVEWSELVESIEKKQCGRVIFILGTNEDVSFGKRLDKYSQLEIEYIRDEKITKGQLKIIKEK
jgi:hypothetical protein